MKTKKIKRIQRHKKIRAILSGSKARPRLCVFRSNQHMYAILIDDEQQKTIASVSDASLKKIKKHTKLEAAKEVGKLIAKEALKNKIETVIFDRGGFLFHGRVKALAEGAREAGLKF